MAKSPSKQFMLNQEIEQLITRNDATGKNYSAEDRALIARYTGAGGQAKSGAKGQGLLYEFFTPDYIAEIMWGLAKLHGFKGGNVLEPSVATGRLIAPAPDKSKVVGFEINPYTKRIAEVLYPQANIHQGYFETAFLQAPRFTSTMTGAVTWLDQFPFDLVIGNPPYGIFRNQYSSYFKSTGMKTIETFFIWQGLQMLKPGGLLVYLVSSNVLRNGQKYQNEKKLIGQIAEIIDAYRLPPVMANTSVPVDIIVLKKK